MGDRSSLNPHPQSRTSRHSKSNPPPSPPQAHVYHDHNHNEGGDSLHYTKKPGEGYWKMKKLADGTRTPMFVEGSPKAKEKAVLNWRFAAGEIGKLVKPPLPSSPAQAPLQEEVSAPVPQLQTRVKTSTQQPPQKLFLHPDDIIKCPLCYDPVIEATASVCGHVFCYDCIHKWMEQRSFCPICQHALTSGIGMGMGECYLHRVYAIDDIIENHLDELGPETKERFMARRAIRLAALLKENRKWRPFKHLQDLRRGLSLYVQSKGVPRVISRTSIQVWRNYLSWIFQRPSTMLIASLIAYTLGVMTGSSSVPHFLAYMWEAMMHYPGPWPLPPSSRNDTVFNLFQTLADCCVPDWVKKWPIFHKP